MRNNQWKLVHHSIQIANATTHGMYSMEVLDVFCKDNEGAGIDDRGNTKLLTTAAGSLTGLVFSPKD